MREFVWHEADSYLHCLNPLTKLVLSVPVAVLASLTDQPMTPLLVALLALGAARWLGGLPWDTLLRSVAFSLVLGFGMFWTGVLYYAGSGSEATAQAYWFSPIRIPEAALVYGFTMMARLLAIYTTSLLFVLTTDPVKFVLALIQQAKLPYRVGYAVFAAYRFIPLVHEELDNIRAAHQIRGTRTGRGLVGRMRQTFGYAIPLLAITVRRAERVALAMDSRGFGASPARTYYRTTSFSFADAVFATCAMVALAAATMLGPTVWASL
jgi:energy-coupling factor transport system permease protein